MVTGRPFIARKIPAKSSRCSGSSLSSALRAVGLVLGDDHLAHRADLPLAEEHVLGAAEADALGAERDRRLGLIGLVGVGAHAQPARRVGPAHQLGVALVDRRLLRRPGSSR